MFKAKNPELTKPSGSTRFIRPCVLAGGFAVLTTLAAFPETDRPLGNVMPKLWGDVMGAFIGGAHAQEVQIWRDETTFTLAPGEAAEWKLLMQEGAIAEFQMTVNGGRVNFDLHGHGGGQSITYEKGRGATGAEGAIEAAFNGEHGWFWRNRDSSNVEITIQVRGEYTGIVD